jgi:chorismate mutase / prephenate dehydratase
MKKELSTIRRKIDAIDERVVKLLNARLLLAQRVGEVKRQARGRIYVAEREAEVLRRLAATNRGPLKSAALQAIYREIMSAALALEKPLVIAFLGPEATYTHAAALRKFGASVDYRAMPALADVFAAVEKGEADYGVVPIENSAEGSVRDSLDLFVETPLKIVAEQQLEIEHSLLSNEPLAKIKRVYSKDQALAQCRRWLQRHLPHAQLVDVDSTALGVQRAAREKGAAAVGPRLAGERYGVAVAADRIQDLKNNTSRFGILGRDASGRAGAGQDMTSLLVSLHHEPGALLKALTSFEKRKLNLTRIESRPSRMRPWDYIFFLDVSGHYDDPAMQAALKELRRRCPLVKWLGSYPAASRSVASR